MTNDTAWQPPVYQRPTDYYVYWTFTREGTCLYVGCTMDMDRRRMTHYNSSPWYWNADEWVISGPHDHLTALDMERREIWRLRPTHNTIMAPRLQEFCDNWAGPDMKLLSDTHLGRLAEDTGVPISDINLLTTIGSGCNTRFVVADSEIARLRGAKEMAA